MNIFVLDRNPYEAATMLCDKHVPKLLLETAQMLCGVFQLQGIEAPYKLTHQHHPCSRWTRDSRKNYEWLLHHGLGLISEYKLRFEKEHKSSSAIAWCLENIEKLKFDSIELTEFVQALPDEYKHEDVIQAYRKYYLNDKKDFARWNRKRAAPDWWTTKLLECDLCEKPDVTVEMRHIPEPGNPGTGFVCDACDEDEIEANVVLPPDLFSSINALEELVAESEKLGLYEDDMRKNVNIKIKLLHPEAVVPAYATPGSVGADITALEDFVIHPGHVVQVRTGFAIAIPEFFEGQVRPRSGMALKHGITVLNAPGTIDSDYRDEVLVLLINQSRNTYHGKKGTRIAQLVINPVTIGSFEHVKDLDTTERSGGFGSTGA